MKKDETSSSVGSHDTQTSDSSFVSTVLSIYNTLHYYTDLDITCVIYIPWHFTKEFNIGK